MQPCPARILPPVSHCGVSRVYEAEVLAHGHLREVSNGRGVRLVVVIPAFARDFPDVRPGAFDVRVAKNAVGPTVMDRKSTRLNSSHLGISYAVFCLKKKDN